jgi:hypothetical protein
MAGSEASLGPKLVYRIEAREDRLADAVVRIAVEVAGLRDRVESGIQATTVSDGINWTELP